MFKNNNREIIRELGKENYQAHKVRNGVTVLAVMLTTILISAVLTVGISFTSTMLNYGETAPGPGCQGSVSMTKEQCLKAKELPQVEWADYVLKCSSSCLQNDVFAGMEVWLLAPERSYYEHNYVNLIEGTYPDTAREIIISDDLAKRLGLEKPVGKRIELEVMIGSAENREKKQISFTICGCFKNPLIALENVYDEVFTSDKFIAEYNPKLLEQLGDAYINLNNLNPLLMKSDVMEKLQDVSDTVDGGGISTKYTNSFVQLFIAMIPALLFVIFIIMSGYFLIYNVFYISIASDIRWFGMMKTLGTTPKQLHRILMIQIKRLALLGIGGGVFVGYFVGNKLAPGVLARTVYGQFYKAPDIIWIVLPGAAFSWFTVYISAGKSMKIAENISPVEAAKYSPRKKHNLFTVLSLAFGGIIFLIACNVTLGYDINKMVSRYHMQDCRIIHNAARWWLYGESYQPLAAELADQIREVPGVTEVEEIYMARSLPDTLKIGNASSSTEYLDSLARVKPEGKLKNWTDAVQMNSEDKSRFSTMYMDYQEKGDIRLKILGLPADRLRKQLPYVEVLEGELEEEKFASGGYVIWQEFYEEKGVEQKITKENKIHAGDMLTLNLYDNEKKKYQKLGVTVMAVVKNDDMFGTGDIESPVHMVMPDTLFQRAYLDYQKFVVSLQIKTDGEITQQQSEEIQSLIALTHNTQLMLDSRYLQRQESKEEKHTMELVGLFLSGLLGVIGISNLINTIASDVFSRKIELASLQSVGMTQRQLFRMLLWDSMKYCLAALCVILPVGAALAVAYALRKAGYFVYEADTIQDAKKQIRQTLCLVILDLNLPDGDGRELLEQLREDSELPVLVLTAVNEEEKVVNSFELGCDDYMVKPFSMAILLKHIEAILKRAARVDCDVYYQNKLVYHFVRKELRKDGVTVHLTALQYRLLEVFLKNRNQVLTREVLLEKVWDTYENYVDEKTLNVAIRRLREKIEDNPQTPVYIQTVFGIGYKWSE